jgi:hypothetical protein
VSERARAVRKKLTKVVDFLIPILQSCRANKKIVARMPSVGSSEPLRYMASYESLTLQEAENFHIKSTEQMESLENKARISLMGITIAISIITGLATSLFSLSSGHFSFIMKLPIVILSVLSVGYMSMAGWAALKVLGEVNEVDQLSPEDIKLPEREKLKRIAIYTERNTNRNLMRNNLVYVSYQSILYAVILLTLAFFLIGIANIIVPSVCIH